MNFKKIILIGLFLIIATTVSSVAAITPEEIKEAKQLLNSPTNLPLMDDLKKGEIIFLKQGTVDGYDYKVVRVKLNQTYTTSGGPVKKDGKYQRKNPIKNKVRIFDLAFIREGTKYNYLDFNLNSSEEKIIGYKYSPAMKGDWIKVYSISPTKTIKEKGKIYKIKYYTVLEVVTAKTAKKFTRAHEKTLIAYYKTFKMPTFKPGNYKWGYFKGNYFTYGNSYIGYYVNHLNDYEYYNPYNRVYKMTPKSTNLLGANMFSKKPSSFTLYAYA